MKNVIYAFFRLAFQLFGVKSLSFYLERPLNAKTFSDGGRTPFGMHVNAVAWQFFCRIPSRIPALSGVLAKNVIYAFFLDWHFSYLVSKSQASILNGL